MQDLRRAPRRRVTTQAQDNRIRTQHLRRRTQPAERTAAATIGIHRRPISGQTVRNRLRERGIRPRRQYVGPVLQPRHRLARTNWAQRHRNWPRHQWANVVFSDESRFTLHNKDGRVRVYRRVGERFTDACVKQVNRFQQSVMVWGGITANEKLQLVVIPGNLNAQNYINLVLNPVVVPFVNNPQRQIIFQQDNARPHTARATRQFLQRNNVQTMEWPAVSPDLSPIEHLWDELNRRIRSRVVQPQHMNELQAALLQEWQNIPLRVLRRLVFSMRRRCAAVINARGGHTRY